VTYLLAASAPAPGAMAQSSQPVSIVVKPFMPLSPAAEAKEFTAGLSEEIVSHLAPISNLTIFRSEVLETLPAATSANIGQRFGSSYVLEGGIRSIDGKIRISSRLLSSKTAAIIWSGVYEAKLAGENILDLEASMAAKIAVAAASTALIKSQQSSASGPVKH
jgi:adenylate cyclase